MTSFFESFHHLCGCGISFPFRDTTESRIPFLFVSRTEECPVSSRESLRVILNLFGIGKHFLNCLSLSIRCHWTLTWRWFDLEHLQVQHFDLAGLRGSFGASPNDATPVKIFHSNSIGSPSIPSNSRKELDCRNSFTWFSHLRFASEWSDIFPKHKTESGRTRTFAFVAWSCVSADLAHEGAVQSTVVTFRISAWWSNINFCVMSNTLWSSSKFCVRNTSKFSTLFGPRWKGGLHRCRHKQSADQYVGLQSFDTNYWCLFCEIQKFPQVLDDFLKASMIGDLHFRFGCPHLAPVSWRWKIECHLVASSENTLLGCGWCFASVSCRWMKHNSDPILDSLGCLGHSNLAEDFSSHSGDSLTPNSLVSVSPPPNFL